MVLRARLLCGRGECGVCCTLYAWMNTAEGASLYRCDYNFTSLGCFTYRCICGIVGDRVKGRGLERPTAIVLREAV